MSISIIATNAVNSGSGAGGVTTLTTGNFILAKGDTLFISAVHKGSTDSFMSDNSLIAWKYLQRCQSASSAVLAIGTVLTAGTSSVQINLTSAGPVVMLSAQFRSTYPLILDQQASNTGSSASVDSGTTGTTNFANELMIAALNHRCQLASPNATFSAVGNSFLDVVSGTSSPTNTGCATNTNTANNDFEVALLYKLVTATGTAHATASVTSSGTNSFTGVIGTFYEAPPSGFIIG